MSGFILCFYTGYGWCDDATHLIWESSYTKTPPVIDGKMDEVWGRTKPLTVTIREAIGGDNPRQVVLRALHSDDTFYVMAQWPDVTKSDMRDPYVWSNEKKDYRTPIETG